MNTGIICFKCKKKASEIEEYIEAAKKEDCTPEEYIIREEGTYNAGNNHFCCTLCYLDIGMPSRSGGWVAP